MASRYEDFINFAIKNEQDAAVLYEKSARLVTLPVQKSLLEKMAEMERGHERALTEILEGKRSVFLGQVEPLDLHLSDYMTEVTLVPESSIEDVLIFAIKAEQKAYELYNALSKLEDIPALKSLLSRLASEEKKHKFDLESEFEKRFVNEN